MLQIHPHFANLSRLFERQLVAERGLEVITKYNFKSPLLSDTDRKALNSLRQLFDELLEGEQILTGSNVTNSIIDAGIALQEVISLTSEQRPVSEFVLGLKTMKIAVSRLLEGSRPLLSAMRTLKIFLTSLAETVRQELEESTTGRTIVPY